ncbi:MAG: ABC transporter ATP-binding protein [Nitrososphaerota archaeon]|nr:ABC transporter ATP-binding protein [Candidatus Calditenuis fumarioli]
MSHPRTPLVSMRGITKRFPGGVVANDRVDFDLYPGEVHALLGENGAGKTTLMNVLYGLYAKDEGEIYVDGKRVEIRSPRDAIRLGIGMVHQQFKLIPRHTVLENVVLGLKEAGFVLNYRRLREVLTKIVREYGWNLDPDAYVWQLTASQKQQVEILKLLVRRARVLILDEPTSILTPQETTALFESIRSMASKGIGVVLVTHKLEEVMRVCDRVTVMRRGKVVAVRKRDELNAEELVTLMVGRRIERVYQVSSRPSERKVLEVRDLVVLDDRGSLAVKGVSFHVCAGEVFGIAGVAGNGQDELLEAIYGLRKAVSGKVHLNGRDVTNLPTWELVKEGVAMIVPEAVKGVGLGLTVAENLMLKCYRYAPYSRYGLLRRRELEEAARRLVEELKIVTRSVNAKASTLSGGNLQRLMVARELFANPGRRTPVLLLASHPTKGLDVAATDYVRRLILSVRDSGAAVVLLSDDLEELISLSDRIGVMYKGEMLAVLEKERAEVEKIGMLMMGMRSVSP